MDFTLKIYQELLESLQNAGFSFLTFADYLKESETWRQGERETLGKGDSEAWRTGDSEDMGNGEESQYHQNLTSSPAHPVTQSPSHQVILRHDVDLLPYHSLRFAQIQNSMGIKGSYYFRAVPESWNEEVIKEIAQLGHEVGYHYENLDTVLSEDSTSNIKHQTLNTKYSTPENLLDHAYQNFQENLEKLRKLTKVETICMHGSPRAKYDNKAIWEKYDYKKLGLLGEPYYDMDFNEFFYLTDTGRKWDGWKTSVRDKVPQQEEWIKQGLVFKTTQDIINAAHQGKLPPKIMFTFHPQRWTDNPFLWTKELVLQNVKNQVKRFLVKR